MDENSLRKVEIALSIIGGVSGLIIGVIFIHFGLYLLFSYHIYSTILDGSNNLYGPDYWPLILGILSLAGGVIGVVSGAIFKYHVKIASILAIIASILCFVGGIGIFGIVSFILLLIAGILGLIKK